MKRKEQSLSQIANNAIDYILTRRIEEFENLTVNGIARHLNVNRTYLSHKFKEDKQFSLHDYILNIKLLRAISFLEAEVSINIDTLAKRMGFSSSDYFRRVFRKKMGTTPAKYRSCYRKTKTKDSLNEPE